ncbi:MAG TPA: fibronectin type III domain-containing protein [Candidatus Angelobacter sp.]|nr:fibronectin type III domain-containing protein [Candidatus Angelobacter sp.]
MRNLLKIAAVLLLCAGFAMVQTPATAQTPATTNPQTTTPDITKPMLEFANAREAKVAWTSHQAADLDLHYSTDRNNLNQAAVGAIEAAGGDNHRATLSNLQPNTTYYVQMTNKSGQPVGPVYTFKTPAQGQTPVHEQPLNPGS